MRRSRASRRGSLTTSHGVSPRHVVGRPDLDAPVVDAGVTLATGALVHAEILARVLGMRLLRLQADIVLRPAAPTPTWTLATVRPASVPERRAGQADSGRPATGSHLDDARRFLADAEEILDGSRWDRR